MRIMRFPSAHSHLRVVFLRIVVREIQRFGRGYGPALALDCRLSHTINVDQRLRCNLGSRGRELLHLSNDGFVQLSSVD